MPRHKLTYLVPILLAWPALASAYDLPARAAPTRCVDPLARVAIYVPSFKGSGALTTSVSSIINMQVWQTLRRVDTNLPGSDFGCGLVTWRSNTANAVDVDEVIAEMPDYTALLLWGEVSLLGQDAVVQSVLRRVDDHDRRARQPEIWNIDVRGQAVSFNPVKPAYSFAPFVIRRDVVARYSGVANLSLCRQPRPPCVGRPVGPADIGAVSQEGEFARVRLGDGGQGWLHLPAITDRSEVIDFVAAVIRLQRGDYLGADELLERVRGSRAGTSLRVEALVLQTAARELAGRSGEATASEAVRLNPLLRSAVQARVMVALSASVRADEQGQRRRRLDEAAQTLAQAAVLFSPADPWLVSVQEIVASQTSNL